MIKVYIIHGWTYSLDKWTELCAELRRLGIEPVLLKVPGLTEPSKRVWDIDGYVAWLDGQLKQIKQPIVVGHSNGGRIALHFVKRYPGRVSRLILIDSAGMRNDQGAEGLKLAILRGLSPLGKLLKHIPSLKGALYQLIGARDYFDAPDNMKVTLRNMHEADRQIDYSQLNVPVTLVWGREDTITPLADGQQLQQHLSGSQLHILDNARHAPQVTDPNAVAKIIQNVVGQDK